MPRTPDEIACTPVPVDSAGFNPKAQIPFDCTSQHIQKAMEDFVEFLGFLNTQLYSKELPRLETLLMPANFSSIVGEFMTSAIPKYCPTVVRNRYHNGHPDLLPKGMFPSDAAQYSDVGIEIKGSRYDRGWQGHNPEKCWLMVFVFQASRGTDVSKSIPPIPFCFVMVAGAQLTKRDWLFSGRSIKSRRTITASVTKSGYKKMMANWIYKSPTSRRK